MSKTWLITGASGLLGHGLCQYLIAHSEDNILALTRDHDMSFSHKRLKPIQQDLRDLDRIKNLIQAEKPDYITHTAGLTSVDACEKDPDMAFLLNTQIPAYLAGVARDLNIPYVFISTDHVTGGLQPNFREEDATSPVNIYAQTKAQAERDVLKENPVALVVRTNFFGRGLPWRTSLTDWIWQKLIEGEVVPAFTDSWFTPISVSYLSEYIVRAIRMKAFGIYHIGGSERLNKYEFSRQFAEFFDLDSYLVKPITVSQAQLSAPRPPDMSMNTYKISELLNAKMPNIIQSFESICQNYQER